MHWCPLTPSRNDSRRTRILISLLSLTFSLLITATAAAQAPSPKWQPGDVVLGTAPGQWKVYRPSISSVIDTVSDTNGAPGISSPGTPSGSALDNTWHLLGLDAGANAIVRFRISPRDPNNESLLPDVLKFFNATAGTSTGPVSLAVARDGHLFVGSSTPATIIKLTAAGAQVASYTIANRDLDRSLTGVDLSSDASSVFYASDGSTIRRLQVSGAGAGTITTFASVGGERFKAVRVLPVCSQCSSGSGVLAAGRTSVSLFDSGGTLVKTFALTGTALAVDSPVRNSVGNTQAPAFFWIASSSAGTFRRVSLADGSATSFSVPGVSGISSISAYGGFGANQPIATVFTPVLLEGSPSNSGIVFFKGAHPEGGDQLTFTGYGFPSGFKTTARVIATSVPPPTGKTDGDQSCTPTILGECTVWELSLDNPLPNGALIMMKVYALLGGVNANTRLFRNERENITLGVRNIDPMGRSRLSVYSLNQIAGNNKGCTYFAPVIEGATLANPGNVTFRFKCSSLPGTQLKTLVPRLSILQVRSGAAPAPFFPGIAVLTGGTCCTVAKYRYDDATNTWVLNVSFSGVTSPSTFLATTFDDNEIASAFEVQFSVQK